jgi:hypothetical protein
MIFRTGIKSDKDFANLTSLVSLQRLLIEFKAGMISTKELKDPKDLSHFLTAQGEDCRVWAKVKPFVNKKSNFARYTTEDPVRTHPISRSSYT